MNTLKATLRVVAMLGAGLLLAACEKPPIDTVQRGVRGTGMVQVYNPRTSRANSRRTWCRSRYRRHRAKGRRRPRCSRT